MSAAAASPARSSPVRSRRSRRAPFRSSSSTLRWSRSIPPRISRSDRGPSPPTQPATRRSCWPHAAPGAASSSWRGCHTSGARPSRHCTRCQGKCRRRHGPRRFCRDGHARAENAAFNDSGSWRDAGARTHQDRTRSEPVRAPARARGAPSDTAGEQPARLFARDRRDRGLFVRIPRAGSAHFRGHAGIPPAAGRQRHSPRDRRDTGRSSGPRGSDGDHSRARQPDRQRDSLFQRGEDRFDPGLWRATPRTLRRIDQGVGIPADDLPASHAAIRPGRTARGPGNGLGLAIVNRIASDHEGALEITSMVGVGTTATLLIPRATTSMRPEDSDRRRRLVARADSARQPARGRV